MIFDLKNKERLPYWSELHFYIKIPERVSSSYQANEVNLVGVSSLNCEQSHSAIKYIILLNCFKSNASAWYIILTCHFNLSHYEAI